MVGIHLKMIGVVLATVFFFTLVSNIIPQVESDAPRQIAFTEDMPIEEIIAIGEEVYRGIGGCAACHTGTGERAPNLLTDHAGQGRIGERCDARIEGLDCKEYLWVALTEPGRYLVDGFPPIMPSAQRTLSDQQIWTLVAFLQDQGGDVTVAAADVVAAGEANGAAAPAATGAAAAPPAVAGADPEPILRGLCLACHQLGDEGTALGPALDGVGARRSAEWLRRKILDPGFETSEGYEALAAIMPRTFGDQLTASQLEALVGYLSELK